jgi:hypothetical protein
LQRRSPGILVVFHRIETESTEEQHFRPALEARFGPSYEYFVATPSAGQLNKLVTKIRGTEADSDVACDDSDVTSDSSSRPPARPSWAQLQLTFEGCDFNYIMAMRLWSLAGAQGAPFFPGGGGAGGFVKSLVPIAAWLNPHSTTGYAVEVSKFFNIQPRGMQFLISSMVRSGLTMEEARAVLGGLYY